MFKELFTFIININTATNPLKSYRFRGTVFTYPPYYQEMRLRLCNAIKIAIFARNPFEFNNK